MIDAIAGHETAPYLESWAALDAEPAAGPASVGELRREAIARFAELGFPSPRLEDWRFTNLSPLARAVLRPAPRTELPSASAARFLFDGAICLAFVDGWPAPELSAPAGLPAGAVVSSLAEALTRWPERVEPHLGRHARFDAHAFVALNTALWRDGAFVWLPRGAVAERPIHLLFLASGAGAPVVAYPRVLVVAEESSQATLVETYAGLADGAYFNCAVTEIVAGPNAVVDHYKVQQESVEAFHLATLQIHQERSSNFFSHSISTGGGLVRNDVNAMLDGEGVECTLNGLYLVNGRQHVDNHMRVDHARPHGHSFELYKGILEDRGRAVFNGRIVVHEGAQKTDAKQSNRNLLLSREALVNSNPQLEIFADDVKCTHGSTVGQLDEEAVFYLRSRGIGAAAAKSLLTYAFASDIVERIKVAPVRRDLEELLFRRLPRGEVVRQAV